MTTDEIYELLKQDNITTETMIDYSHDIKTKGKSIQMSVGRIWFNTLFPDNFELINTTVDVGEMNKIIKKIVDTYTTEESADLMQHIQEHAFKMSAINPSSFSINGFIPSDEWKSAKAKFVKSADSLTDQNFIKGAERLTKMLMEDLNIKGIGIIDSVNSGSKGSLSEWQALLVSRGFVVDIEGNISRITEAYNDGLSIESYYKGGGQARRNHYVKSTMTATPGYLARRVTMATANIQIQEDDCGTKKYLTMNITNPKEAYYFTGRFYKTESGELAEVTDSSKLVGKVVEFRSPLYCLNKTGLCSKCYGTLYKKLNTKNVGIAAGGAINNETVNALMKLRHQMSQVKLVDVNFIDIIDKSNVDKELFNTLFKIEERKISAKVPCNITIDKKDYREDSIQDYGNKFLISGILDINYGTVEDVKKVVLPLNFNVDLFKQNSVIEDGSVITLHYELGDKILSKDYYVKELNPATIDRLFEGGFKYIKHPEMLLKVMRDELTLVDNIHLELVISNMFRSNKDLSVPGRLVNYEDCELHGSKKLPFIDSWLSGLAFENPNKALKVGLIGGKEASLNPIEKIVLDKHYFDEEAEA